MASIQKKTTGRFIFVSIIQIFALLFVPTGSFMSLDTWCWAMTMFCIVLLLFQLYTFRWFSDKKHLLFPVFIVLAYLFHISQVALYIYNPEISEQFGTGSVMRKINVQEAAAVAVRALICVYWGAITYLAFGNKRQSIMYPPKEYQPSPMFIAVIIIIGLLSDVAYTVYISIIMGYGNDEESLFSTLIRPFSLLLTSGIALLLTRDNISLRKKTIIFALFIFYKAFGMLGGYRSFALITIVLTVYFFTRTCYRIKLNLKTIIVGGVSVMLLTTFLVGIRETRQEEVSIAEIAAFSSETSVNPIVNQLSEFGITLNVITEILSIKNGVGSDGSQLKLSMMTVVPGSSSLFSGMDLNKMSVDGALSIHAMGGSFIGDLLFDFGDKGIIIAAFILGFFFARVFYRFELNIDRRYFNHVAFVFPIMVDMIFCIRTSTLRLPRVFVWYALIFFFFWFVFSGRGIKFKA